MDNYLNSHPGWRYLHALQMVGAGLLVLAFLLGTKPKSNNPELQKKIKQLPKQEQKDTIIASQKVINEKNMDFRTGSELSKIATSCAKEIQSAVDISNKENITKADTAKAMNNVINSKGLVQELLKYGLPVDSFKAEILKAEKLIYPSILTTK